MNDPHADLDPAAGIRVQVTELKSSADALFIEDEHGEPVLLIRRKQSFTSAVEGVRDAMEIPEQRARAIVRVYHPEAVAWGDQNVAALITEPPASPARLTCKQPPTPPDGKPARHLRLLPRWTVTAIAAVAALGVGYNMPGQTTSQASPGATPDGIQLADAEPYTSAAFKDFAIDGEMACTPIGPLEAKCLDIDGKVMYSEASVGSDWTQFNFTYDEGDHRIALRVFSNEAAARLWVQADGTQESVHNLVQYGRYALWGSDQARLREYLALLQDQDEPSGVLDHKASGRHAAQAEHVTVAAAKQAQPKPYEAKHAKTDKSKKRVTPPSTTAAATPAQVTASHRVVSRGGRSEQAIHTKDVSYSPATQATPMPRRLAVLALGTLGIDPTNPPTLAEANTMQEMGRLVAISIVMGVDPADTGVPVQEIPSLPVRDAAEPTLADPSSRLMEERLSLGLFDRTETALPAQREPVEVTPTPVEAQPAPTPPASAEEAQMPTEDKPPTTPETPQQPQQPDPPTAIAPQEPVDTEPSTEVPTQETDPAPVETAPSVPAEDRVLEDPVVEDPVVDPGDSVDGDQDVDEDQGDTAAVPAEDDGAPTPVEEPDTGAELVTIPDAWRGDQAV